MRKNVATRSRSPTSAMFFLSDSGPRRHRRGAVRGLGLPRHWRALTRGSGLGLPARGSLDTPRAKAGARGSNLPHCLVTALRRVRGGLLRLIRRRPTAIAVGLASARSVNLGRVQRTADAVVGWWRGARRRCHGCRAAMDRPFRRQAGLDRPFPVAAFSRPSTLWGKLYPWGEPVRVERYGVLRRASNQPTNSVRTDDRRV